MIIENAVDVRQKEVKSKNNLLPKEARLTPINSNKLRTSLTLIIDAGRPFVVLTPPPISLLIAEVLAPMLMAGLDCRCQGPAVLHSLHSASEHSH